MPRRISQVDQVDDDGWNLERAAGYLRRATDGEQAVRDDLLRRHAALLESQREHRELAAFIVHDLKAPLSVVCAGLEWVRGQLLPEQAGLADAIADAHAAAGRLGAMIGDLLTVSRLDEGDFPLRRQPVRIQGLFEVIAHAYARRADEKGIALATAPESDLEVQADPTLLQRVLENIVENAFRHTRPNGHIALAARPWHGVEIAVSNDGPPIPPPDRARIFNKFARAERDAPDAGSVGLGLYFCRRAVEAHGGVIDIVETSEWPTSFRINLP
jgi:signal transduction histidine kinase